ncbi:MAG: hypothetical protein ACXVH7_12090 [Thermoanaerobaculia bacterium]
MVDRNLPSLKLLLVGWLFFVVFIVLFYFIAPHNEASLLTRFIVFVGLIPPPVCFAAGIALAFAREVRAIPAGAWANGAAIFAHGLAVILVLQTSLA